MTRPSLLDLAAEKVLVLDGAMGTMIQRAGLGPDDFAGHEGCNELLVETRPDVIRAIHEGYLAAGCDVLECNTFGAFPVVLEEYGLAHRARDLARTAARLALGAARDASTADRPRYVLGSLGPGTKLPTLGHITFRDLRDAYVPALEGLLEAGVDGVYFETAQDLLQLKAALDGLRVAAERVGRSVPVLVTVTIERTGTLLLGTPVEAALAALRPLGAAALGFNCGTGPSDLVSHVGTLSRLGPERLVVMPNAGMPEIVDGELTYALSPRDFADQVARFVTEHGVGLVGGCCGTTPDHLRALVARVGHLPSPARPSGRGGPRGGEVSSLYQAVTLRQEPAPLLIGERTNANGSKEFRLRLVAGDVEGQVGVARDQEAAGAHLLDVCVAYVGRDERADLSALVPRLAREVRLPLVLDSTDPDVLEAGLELYGGRMVLNSIHFEDGVGRFDRVCELARRFGAVVVALAIDEQGMAMTAGQKLEVAERIVKRFLGHGLPEDDLVLDLLTFTVAGGDDTRHAAVETLEALAAFKARHPAVHTLLGVSNVSFGLKPAARRVLNAVFLAEAVARGLDAAIVNARTLVPLAHLEPALVEAARRVLLDDRAGHDPLGAFLALVDAAAGPATEAEEGGPAQTPEQHVRRAIVLGSQAGLTEALDRLLAAGRDPLAIVQEVLLAAMREVGELFASGRLQLPFVLQSAEAMKAAVRHLEPRLAGLDLPPRGTVVLATVKGDVHDIGKNLVNILLTNHGYRVIDLGVKVPIEAIVQAVRDHAADAVGMSGLLVRSTVVMQENLRELARLGYDLPVLVGGAALTRKYAAEALVPVYPGVVGYAATAMDAVPLLEEAAISATVTPAKAGVQARSGLDSGVRRNDEPGNNGPVPRSDQQPLPSGPTPPFWGSRVLDAVPLDETLALLDTRALFRGRWRYRQGKLPDAEYESLVAREVRPVLERLSAEALREGWASRAVYGYFPVRATHDGLRVLHADGSERAWLPLPRQPAPPHLALPDWFRDQRFEAPDVLPLFVVTVHPGLLERIRAAHAADQYRDYLHWHGFSIELVEATAEWLHRRVRRELGVLDDQGRRFSFGYPAAPDLALQEPLLRLLEAERLGVTLTESWQMVPEQSVSALVVVHPGARLFDLG